MLVLSVHESNWVRIRPTIGPDVWVSLCTIESGNKARLGFTAPLSVVISRNALLPEHEQYQNVNQRTGQVVKEHEHG